MPIPDSYQPSLAAPGESSNLGFRRFLHSILGLVSAIAFFVAIAPRFFEGFIPGFNVERWGGAGPVRFAAFFAFLVAVAIRIRLNPGKQLSRSRAVWARFASDIAGTVVPVRRQPTMVGWEGGTTVQWESHGVAFVLSGYTDTSRNDHTRVQAEMRLSQALRFYALPRTFLTQTFASPKIWGVLLALAKREAERQGESAAEAAVAKEMSFMVEKEVLTGDPAIDAAVIVKSDNQPLAREFFSDAGVSHWLRELNTLRKGWQLNLIVKTLPDVYQLTLDITGVLSDPKELDAARQLAESAVGRLADRGILSTEHRKAAGAGR